MSPLSASAHHLTSLARAIADRRPVDAPSQLILVPSVEPPDAADLRLIPVPAAAPHPADPWVGTRVKPDIEAIGLATSGRVVRLDDLPDQDLAEASSVVVLTDRLGHFGAEVRLPGAEAITIDDAPDGWVADVLRRVLDLPTTPPLQSVGACVEAVWLDAIATRVLSRPGRVRCWESLARLHPLAGDGPALPGMLLALETAALEAGSSWSRLRELWCRGGHVHQAGCLPLGLHPVPLGQWFDDGSFARWVQRHLVPADALIDPVCDALPCEIASELIDALCTVQPGRPSRD